MSDKRDKKLLMERNKKKKNILGFEQVEDEDQKKRYEEEIEKFKPKKESDEKDDSKGLLDQLSEYAEPVIKNISKVTSKVRDALRDTVFRATTPTYTPDREKVIEDKVKGKKGKKD